MLIGGHVSIAGGMYKSISRGEEIGGNAIQTFASSPRTMKYKKIESEHVNRYLDEKKNSGIKFHVFHGVYLINLAHENPDYVQVCVDMLNYYQNVASEIGGLGTVFHIGSHKGAGFDSTVDQVAEAIVGVVNKMPANVWLLLENTAGQSGAIGRNFQELSIVIDKVDKKGGDSSRLGICVDTQHAFASGYDLRNTDGLNTLVKDIDDNCGLNKLKLIHVNDSLTEFDSHRDRHANLGEGEIGLEGLEKFVNHKKIANIPLILEVPGENKSGPRSVDVSRLESLIK